MNEQALISDAQGGNLDAFNTLILHYQDSVFNTALRILGEEDQAADAAQDAFISAFKSITSFRGGSFKAAAQYEVLRTEAERVIDVVVVSAMDLDGAQQARLAQALKGRFGRDVRMHTRTDASLIGGAIVRAGDLVIDGSLKGRLGRLAAEMTA